MLYYLIVSSTRDYIISPTLMQTRAFQFNALYKAIKFITLEIGRKKISDHMAEDMYTI